jgi:hypothetical protein
MEKQNNFDHDEDHDDAMASYGEAMHEDHLKQEQLEEKSREQEEWNKQQVLNSGKRYSTTDLIIFIIIIVVIIQFLRFYF